MVVITVIAMKQAINNLLLKYMLKKVDISGLVYSGLCQSCLNGSFSVLNNSEGIDNAFDSLLDCEAMYKSESKTNGDNIASTDDEINFYFFYIMMIIIIVIITIIQNIYLFFYCHSVVFLVLFYHFGHIILCFIKIIKLVL